MQARKQILPSTLPLPLTRLIGREHELAEGSRLLLQQEVRLLTISGPGGVGKTRLAVEIAATIQKDFGDGIHFISLASLQDDTFVLPSIAQALQLQGGGSFAPLEHLKAFLHTQNCLLVLDCFEHVIDAAPLLVELLTSCPSLKLLVTSRETLHVRGERELSLMPLALPDMQTPLTGETISNYAAIALFIERAQEADSAFHLTAENAPLITEICRRLDGLPLALELAAARLRLLSPQALLERLTRRLTLLTDGPRDVPPHQRTLRATLQWSYDLLSSQEQRLFRLLASFSGGCTLSALEAVGSAFEDEIGSIVEGVASLLNKHLLYQREQDAGERRLMMLATIREYGWEQLLACHEQEEVMNAQATYYLHLAEEATAAPSEQEQVRLFDRLEWERENLRTALKWFVEQGERGYSMEMALRLIQAVSQFWLVRWYISEERHWVERALVCSEGVAPLIRAAAQRAAGWLAFVQDDGKRAEEHYIESLRLYREVGDRRGMAVVLHWLGSLAFTMRNDAVTARTLLEESYTLASNIGDKLILVHVFSTRGDIALHLGDILHAQECFEQSLIFSKAVENRKYLALALRGLGRVRLAQGNLEEARTLIKESLALTRNVKDKLYSAHALDLLGLLFLAQGDASAARTLLEESYTFFQRLGVRRHIAYALSHAASAATAQGDTGTAQKWYEESLTLFRQIGDFAGMAACLQRWGTLLAQRGELLWSVRLWGTVQTLPTTEGPRYLSLPIELIDVSLTPYKQEVEKIRAQLGPQAFAAAWEEGRAMTPEQVLASYGQATISEASEKPDDKKHELSTLKETDTHDLTAREVEVLRLVAQGCSDAQIAETLIISPRTVHAHLRTIYRKLDVPSRFAAIRYALDTHLI